MQRQAGRPVIVIIVKEDLQATAPRKNPSSAELFISDFCDLHIGEIACDLHIAEMAFDLCISNITFDLHIADEAFDLYL